MRKLLAVGGVVLLCSGTFAAGYFVFHRPVEKEAPSKVNIVQFTYGKYFGTISSTEDQKEETVTFRPPIIGNDDVVAALQATSEAAFHDEYTKNAQPVVEVQDEVSYITFATLNGKDYYLLFKNDRGQVGSATFWRDNLDAKAP